ncbi:protein-glutamine gamma-glutamyltransferase K-like [Branchiostoma lanceolatum]|uniref:protein-glutamine gamma-glutamyltransferase K-like n=1 Tax=Branchiostoma lanceolatum TaxID=7740 RepID=UPI003453605A
MADRPRGFAFSTGRRVRRPYSWFPMIIERPRFPPFPAPVPVDPGFGVDPPLNVPQPPKPDRPLELMNFIFHTDENGPAHHTDEYLENVVVRRGQPFSVGVVFDREVNLEKDNLLIEFQFGNNPLPSKGTLLRLPVGDALKEGEWSAAVEKAEGQTVKMRIMSPANAIVGRYHVVVETELADERSRSRKVDNRNVVVLFNPWCKEDLTYLDDDTGTKLEEYVLNEYGSQYYGSHHRIGRRGWNFGQFEPGIPDIVLLMLEKSGLNPSARRSAVSVSRAMSKMVNAQDDNGVLEGNWSGDYSWGTPPTGWNGSVDILRQWGRERRSVRYGQCWVFSGVLTTVLRCLGIPARSITNFQSAHDTDVSMTIDKYSDRFGLPLESEDSVWNFHVWNEAWMARPDLPEGYGGWQAVDSTPQETSDGIYQCGPCPVIAVKNGQVYLPHDTKFVFAEVNADKVYWKENNFGYFDYLRLEKRSVGFKISTKPVGSGWREDVTENYKHPEGSDQERVAVRAAVEHGSTPWTYDEIITHEDVEFSISADEEVYIGQDIHVTLTITNTSLESRHVTAHLTANATYYTGVLGKQIGELEEDVTIAAGGEDSVKMTFTPREYLDKLVEQSLVKVFVLAHVDTTKQAWAGEIDFRLLSPDLVITVKLRHFHAVTFALLPVEPLITQQWRMP